MSVWCLAFCLVAAGPSGQDESILKNGGFESCIEAPADASGEGKGWRFSSQMPAAWTPNPAYPGELTVCSSEPDGPAAHGGERFVRIAGVQAGSAHLYQMCQGLEPGKWYRVSAWVRGGAVSLSFYEYFKSGPIGGQGVAQSTGGADGWKLIEGFYRAPTDGYLRSALALSVPPRQNVDVDDVRIDPIVLADAPGGNGVTLETDSLRLTISPQGILREFRCKVSGTDYAAGTVPFPILRLVRRGVPTPACGLSRDGDLLRVRFLDSDLQATLRFTLRKEHVLFEVVEVTPDDVEQLSLVFPLRRLATVAGAFNATYDEQFGACLLGTTANVWQQVQTHGSDIVGLAAHCTRDRGMAGARFALVAAPRDRFKPAIMEAERANGLPCPMLEGRWARDSEPVRRSYLFMVDATEDNTDKTIEYAKLGHFGTIILLKNNWLATHGHFEINKKNFPEGLASLKRTVEKIHAAGLGAGVHVFGPSISPNDPYITPRPDDRLAFVACPPLAEAVDEKTATLTLTGPPPLPPNAPRSRAFPGHYLRIGDEIIRYQDVEPGPSWRFLRCQRGALGTKAVAHAAEAEVKGLLTMWGFFLVDPDSTLADELTANFANVFNACDFDMVYFDASDGIQDAYLERWYYLNKLHLGYYRKFNKDVLYQTSNGAGSNLLWHIVPRSASADGHGDLKAYLDERLPGMRGMAANFTRADVGWYYMFNDVRPDQIEYVAAKTIGLEGSISIETSLATMEKHPRARQMVEMVGRYEQARLANCFPEEVKAQLREPGKDFKLLRDTDGWKLYRATYEEPRYVEALDGEQNTWAITNNLPEPCHLGVEIACGFRNAPTTDYHHPAAVTLEPFDDTAPYQRGEENRAERFYAAPDATLTADGAAEPGVSFQFVSKTDNAKIGDRCILFSAVNSGTRGGWCATGRRFSQPVDLSGSQAIALWIDGDGKGETFRLQLRDTAGRAATWTTLVSFQGWRLCVFRTADAPAFDWSKTEYLTLRLEGMAGGSTVQVRLDDLRALPELHPAPPLVCPTVQINGKRIAFPRQLQAGQALTGSGLEEARFWPGGMKPGEPVPVPIDTLVLQPGKNRVTVTADTAAGYPGDVNVLFYRLSPLSPPADMSKSPPTNP